MSYVRMDMGFELLVIAAMKYFCCLLTIKRTGWAHKSSF
jgi:hypothetical protein